MLRKETLEGVFVLTGVLRPLAGSGTNLVSPSSETLKSSMAVGFRLGFEEADAGGPLKTRFLVIVRDSGDPNAYALVGVP